MKANVTQIMVEEHKLILRMITLVEQNTARLEEKYQQLVEGYEQQKA